MHWLIAFALSVGLLLAASSAGADGLPAAKPDSLPGPSDAIPSLKDSGAAALAAPGLVCGAKHHCGDMTTCAEAYHYLTECGLSDLDRDSDGIPCETICGKTLATMHARIDAQPYSVPSTGVADLPSATEPQALLGGRASPADQPPNEFDCKLRKTTCKQMTSCEEATFYLQTCGITRLDGNNDGIPCNGLCR